MQRAPAAIGARQAPGEVTIHQVQMGAVEDGAPKVCPAGPPPQAVVEA